MFICCTNATPHLAACISLHHSYAPISPADLYSARLGGVYGSEAVPPPFIGGHDGVGVVSVTGPGVRGLSAGDVVLPGRSFLGTWRTAGVVQERDLIRIPPSITDLLTDHNHTSAVTAVTAVTAPSSPPARPSTPTRAAGSNGGTATAARAVSETAASAPAGAVHGSSAGQAAGASAGTKSEAVAAGNGARSAVGGGGSGRVDLEALALAREAAVAHVLLESYGKLKPGDAVLINAPGSTVGQALLQLCRLLKLRAVAVVRWPSAGSAGGGSSGGSSGPAATAVAVGGGSSGREDAGAWGDLVGWLTGLGATVVVRDEGSVRVSVILPTLFSRVDSPQVHA